jgi:hypothetical protein
VALVGKLEDMRPAEILIFLAESQKTGKLNFTTGTQEGMVLFRDGKIIYAASSSIRETFGSIALTLNIVNRRQLDQALLLQHKSREDKRLGEILVSLGAMTQDDVQRILAHQVGQVVREIFEWKSGYFKFRNLEVEHFGDIEVDAKDFVLGTPLDTRSVALDAARVQDETSREIEPIEEEDEETSGPPTLAEIMTDVAAPVLTAETIREILEAAEKVFSRGVILAVHDQSVRGLAQFGLVETIAPPSHRVRELNLSVKENSIIARVVREREIFRGEPDHVRSNSQFVYVLGGEWPREAVALPMIIRDRVALVVYGDNQPDGLPIGSTGVLEATLAALGRRLAMAPRA